MNLAKQKRQHKLMGLAIYLRIIFLWMNFHKKFQESLIDFMKLGNRLMKLFMAYIVIP